MIFSLLSYPIFYKTIDLKPQDRKYCHNMWSRGLKFVWVPPERTLPAERLSYAQFAHEHIHNFFYKNHSRVIAIIWLAGLGN